MPSYKAQVNGDIWEGIIIALDRHFVVYPRGADVDEGASVDEGAGVEEADFFYTGSSTPAPPG